MIQILLHIKRFIQMTYGERMTGRCKSPLFPYDSSDWTNQVVSTAMQDTINKCIKFDLL